MFYPVLCEKMLSICIENGLNLSQLTVLNIFFSNLCQEPVKLQSAVNRTASPKYAEKAWKIFNANSVTSHYSRIVSDIRAQ